MDLKNFFQIKNKYGNVYISYNIIAIYIHNVLKKFKKYIFQSFFVSYLKDDFYSLEINLKVEKENDFKDVNEIYKQITVLFKKLLKLKIVVIVKI